MNEGYTGKRRWMSRDKEIGQNGKLNLADHQLLEARCPKCGAPALTDVYLSTTAEGTKRKKATRCQGKRGVDGWLSQRPCTPTIETLEDIPTC